MRIKKVNWQWDYGVYMAFCPYCNEPVYEKDKCVFCGKPYKWVEGKFKPTEIEHQGYTIVQSTDNHILVYNKDGHMVYHASCTKKLTEDELKEHGQFAIDLVEGRISLKKAEKCD